MVRIFFGIILGIILVPLAGLCGFITAKYPSPSPTRRCPAKRRSPAWLCIAHRPRNDPAAAHRRQRTNLCRRRPRLCRQMRRVPWLSWQAGVDRPEHVPGGAAPVGEASLRDRGRRQRRSTGRNLLEGCQWNPFDGMPDFKTQLSNTEIWQVSLLLANADKPLPPAALSLLRGEGGAPAPAPQGPAAPIPPGGTKP